MVLEKTVESPLDWKEIKPVNPKGSQSWIFIGRTDAEAEAPKLWPPDVKCQLTGKAPDAEKDWGQEERGLTEDEFVGWHHWLSGHYFEHTPGDSEEQRSLACYRSCGCRVRHNLATEQQHIQQTFIHTRIRMCLCICSHIHMYHLQYTDIFLFT